MDIKNCSEVVGNPDRTNIVYVKHFRVGSDVDSLMSILTPMAQDLLLENICYPLTIIYIPLKWCGYAYKIFESVLGINQYYPKGSMLTPENRLFAQFHSPQTTEMKDVILKQLSKRTSRKLVDRAGRNGQPATAVLYYNNRDIAKNKPGMQEAVRHFCRSDGECLRHILLSLQDTDKKYFKLVSPNQILKILQSQTKSMWTLLKMAAV